MAPDPSGWPWPLDGIQKWFEDLWSWISTAAQNAVKVVSDWVWGAIYWVRDRLSEGIDWLRGAVKGFIDWLWTSVSGAFSDLTSIVWDWMTAIYLGLSSALNTVGSSLSSALSAVFSGLQTFMGNVWNSLAAGVNAVGSALSGALSLAKDAIVGGLTNVYTGLVGVVGEVGNTLSTAFNGAVSALGGWVSDALAGVAKALGEALSGFLTWITEKLGWLAQSIIGAAIAVKDAVVGFFDMVGRGFISLITSIFGPGTPDTAIQNEAETAFKSMLDELEQLTKIERKSQIPYEALATAIVSTAARFLVLKIGVEAAGAAVDAAHPIKGLKAHEIAAGLMAVLDMPAVIGPILAEPINQGIFIPWRQYWASRYTPMIPGPGDLIRFVVREVIDVGVFRSNLALQGFSVFWADAYWEAHWELPSRGEVVDAFHRDVVSEGELNKFMIWHDYKPEPRPGIAKSDLAILSGIRKTLIPRVDLRRGYAAGSLTWEQLVERYKWLGYEDDAELMASIQVAVAFVAERGKLRDNAKDDYVRGFILEDTLRADLVALGFGDVEIDYFVADAKADRLRKHKQDLLASYEDGYLKDLVTDDELAERAGAIITDPDTLSLFLERAYIRKYKKPKVTEVA